MKEKINKVMGYAFFVIGVSRVIIVILSIIMAGTIFMDTEIDLESNIVIKLFAFVITIIQFVVATMSIPMIFVNKKENLEVVKGYLYGLGAILIELFLPSIFMIFLIFAIATLYMKAGSMITKTTNDYVKVQKEQRKTEWFYNKSNTEMEEDSNNITDEIGKEKKNAKIIEEIFEWKKLLDSGEIDEESFNDIKEKLIKKMKK